jgi:hypothetical protein
VSGRRIALVGLAGAVVAGAVVAVVFPHGKPRPSTERVLVTRYVDRVNALERQLTEPLGEVSGAYQLFATKPALAPRARSKLADAERTLHRLETRLAGVPTPPAAARLHAMVLRVVRDELRVARELDALVRFLPTYDAGLARLREAARRLSHDLVSAPVPTPHRLHGTPAQIKRAQAQFAAAASAAAAGQADAVAAYDEAVAAVAAQLRRVKPPPVLAPAYRSQLASLSGTWAAGERLAEELRKPTRSRVPQLSRAFALASRSSQTLTAQRAEIAAVEAYNARVRAIGSETTAARGELARLQRQLP